MTTCSKITVPLILGILVLIGCTKDKTPIPPNQSENIDNNLISGGGSSSFERVIGGIKLDALHSVKQTDDGGFVICGFTENQNASEKDILILKTDNTGKTEWIKTFSEEFTDQGWYIQETTNNDYIIAATSSISPWSTMSPTSYDGMLLRINNQGTILWSKFYTFGDHTQFSSVQQTDDGGFIICGLEYSNDIAFLLKTDASGNETWRKTFSNKKILNFIEKTNDGGYITCGSDNSNTLKQSDIYVIRTNDVGDTLWTKSFGDNYRNTANTIHQVTNGYILSGYTIKTSTASGFITYIDSVGNEIWTEDYSADNVESINFLNLTNDQEFIVVGSESFGNISDCYLMKISSIDGSILWKKAFSRGSYNLLYEVEQTMDNGFIMVGYTLEDENGNGYIIKTDENGN